MSHNSEDNISVLPSDPSDLAKYGISLIINNRVDEAQELFRTNTETIQMTAGYAIVVSMDALTSFDEAKFQTALQVLRETEKKCAADMGWLKSMKSKVLGIQTSSLAERLETQIILADTQVCVSILTFLQQEFSGFLKGGWILRKAWKIYQQTYLEIAEIYKRKFGNFNLPEPTDFEWVDNSANITTRSNSLDSSEVSEMQEEWTVPDSNRSSPSSSKRNSRNGSSQDIDPETIARLMGAVCFGYGVLQLGLSLLPPSFHKVTNFFGFSANRTSGISNLMYARKGTDMRAPLATLALLWYHTIVRPFYALDGNNVKAGVEAASLLIQESKSEYEKSALFLFFAGRTYRLDGNIPMALESFQLAVNNSAQREIKLLALHEVGWCNLIQLDCVEAQKVLIKLKVGSRWSKVFYSYLCIICSGSFGRREFSEIQELQEMYRNTNKTNQLDLYIQRRIKIFPNNNESLQNTPDIYWKFLVYELIYLWNALPSCSFSSRDNIIQDCNDSTHEPMPGLTKLIQGECYNIIDSYDNAVASLRECIAKRSNVPQRDDLYISAYAEFTLGSLLIKNPETRQEGKAMLQHCSHYKDYDFDNKLLVRINMALKSVS